MIRYRKYFFATLISLGIAVVIVSYTEKQQINFFMPLRELLFIPAEMSSSSDEKPSDLPKGMPHKSSKDGYYINPWQASGIVSGTAVSVLQNGCSAVDKSDRARMIAFGSYFAETAKKRRYNNKVFSVWVYPIHFSYGLTPGWISGMAQGNIAVVLAASSLCEENPELEKFARMSINSFEVPVEHGGVLVDIDEGYWYEEYAQAGVAPPLVLNGHIYAVLALRELRTFDARADRLYQKGVAAVSGTIQHFDATTWSYYDRVGTPANNIYQQPLHARQMLEMYEASGEEIFLEYHNKFNKQLWSPFSSLQRFLMKPTRFLGFLLAVNTVFIFILAMIFLMLKGKQKFCAGEYK